MPLSSSLTRSFQPIKHTLGRRGYAIPAKGPANLQVFNRNTKWLQRERAAANIDTSRRVDYLRDEAAARLCDRLLVRTKVPATFVATTHTFVGHQPQI